MRFPTRTSGIGIARWRKGLASNDTSRWPTQWHERGVTMNRRRGYHPTARSGASTRCCVTRPLPARLAELPGPADANAPDTPMIWSRLRSPAARGPSSRRLRARVLVGIRPESGAVVEAVERGHLVVAQLEVEHGEIRLDPLRVRRPRDHDIAQLDAPSDQHLRRRLALRLGNRGDGRVVQQPADSQRTVSPVTMPYSALTARSSA